MEQMTTEEMYKREIAMLQEQVHNQHIRIKELLEEIENLKKQLFGEPSDGC